MRYAWRSHRRVADKNKLEFSSVFVRQQSWLGEKLKKVRNFGRLGQGECQKRFPPSFLGTQTKNKNKKRSTWRKSRKPARAINNSSHRGEGSTGGLRGCDGDTGNDSDSDSDTGYGRQPR